MRYLRKHRCRLGVALAAVFLLTAVMPGLVAAAQGVQLQAHICSADGTQAPAEGLPTFASDEHCQLCPAGFAPVPLIGPATADIFAFKDMRTHPALAGDDARLVRRTELTPLNGRAPPLQG